MSKTKKSSTKNSTPAIGIEFFVNYSLFGNIDKSNAAYLRTAFIFVWV